MFCPMFSSEETLSLSHSSDYTSSGETLLLYLFSFTWFTETSSTTGQWLVSSYCGVKRRKRNRVVYLRLSHWSRGNVLDLDSIIDSAVGFFKVNYSMVYLNWEILCLIVLWPCSIVCVLWRSPFHSCTPPTTRRQGKPSFVYVFMYEYVVHRNFLLYRTLTCF